MFKLSRRAGSAKWQVRKRWPTDVASFLKGEFNRSTGEGDRKAAQAQLPFLAAARELAVEIEAVRAAGATSLREIAQRLNERHVEAPRGGSWHPSGVKRVLERLGA